MSAATAVSSNGPHVLFAGRTTVDAVYRLDEFPDEDSKAWAGAFRVAPGGPACNAAMTHARLGGRATLVSALGGGSWAELARGELAKREIRLVNLANGTAYETPLTTVLVNAARSTRTIVNPPPTQIELRRVSNWNSEWGDVPRVALSDGFHLGETMALLAACRNLGCTVCLDGGSWKPGTEELAGLLTVAICGERFAAPGAVADADRTLAWFAERGVSQVAVTRGSRPILGIDHGRRFEVVIDAIEAVDTLGAGDVLHGAFCFRFAQGHEFEASLRWAAQIATRSCLGMGIECWSKATPAS